jgi:hypothetical protein
VVLYDATYVKDNKTNPSKEDVMKKQQNRIEITRSRYELIRRTLRDMKWDYDLAKGNFNHLAFGRGDWKKRTKILSLLQSNQEMHDGGTGLGCISVPKKAVDLFESL